MSDPKRTTIVVDRNWKRATAKAKRLGITMSQVMRALIAAWLKGEVHVGIKVESVVEKPSRLRIEYDLEGGDDVVTP